MTTAMILLAWLTVGAGVALWTMRRPDRTAAFVLGYVTALTINHVPGAATALSPHYFGPFEPETQTGFALTALGGVAFLAGVVAAQRLLRKDSGRAGRSERYPVAAGVLVTVAGFATYLALQPLIGTVPTLQALLAAASNLMVVGMMLALAATRAAQQGARLAVVLAATIIFPAMTLVLEGFLGFGIMYALVIGLFALRGSRPRLAHFAAAGLALIVGLSAFATYMRDRTLLRAEIWSDRYSLSDSIDAVLRTLETAEFFDPTNPEHLAPLDARLNQNWFVGMLARNLESGAVQQRGTEVFEELAYSLIPRALWTDKPAVAGGGERAAAGTLQEFSYGSTFGTGQVYEWLFAFGLPGLILGLFAHGLLLGYFDLRAAEALTRGDPGRFILFALPALAMLDVLAFLTLTITSVPAGLVVGALLARLPFLQPRPSRETRRAARTATDLRPKIVFRSDLPEAMPTRPRASPPVT